MLKKYSEFLLESDIYGLILESKLVFSKDFKKILKSMSNDIAKKLIEIHDKDEIDGLKHNYIDITDENGRVSFIVDTKAQEFLKNEVRDFVIVQGDRYLTHSSSANRRVFDLLGFDTSENREWSPARGTIGTIEGEVVSPVSGKTYILFREKEGGRLTVVNKVAIEQDKNSQIWKTARNPTTIGRVIRAILRSLDYSYTDRDIEKFVNDYKSSYDVFSDKLKQFAVVSGGDIAHWYKYDNYVSGGGTLNNSCMGEVDDSYFDIYVHNKNVEMIILYGDDGEIKDGAYISNKIKGRAILWNDVSFDGKTITFMDRIYTKNDSDKDLFIKYATNNGWWYKKNQNMDTWEAITNGETSKLSRMVVSLRFTDFDEYPYLDTLAYCHIDDGILTNDDDYNDGDDLILLKDTSGGYEEV